MRYKIDSLFEQYPPLFIEANARGDWSAWFDATARHYYANLLTEVEEDLACIAKIVGKPAPELAGYQRIMRAKPSSNYDAAVSAWLQVARVEFRELFV